MTTDALLKSFARTVVPAVVGMIVTLALRWFGADLHGYAPQITAGVTFGYYALVRLAEEHLSPSFGWLLGVAAAPRYVQPAKKTAAKKTAAKKTAAKHRTAGHADVRTVLGVALIALFVVVILVLLGAVGR